MPKGGLLNDSEVDLTVTYLTPRSKFSIVNVILPMATNAHARGLCYKKGPNMALFAFDRDMFSYQWISCLLCMVKFRPLPVLFSVTGGATFLPKLPFVIVILLVTIIANRSCIFKKQCLMAFPTADLHMLS